MQIARVIGHATSTVKHPSMQGWKLLLVQPYLVDERTPDGDVVIAIDRLGAGRNDRVVITSDGAATRVMVKSDTTPIRWHVAGIVDE
ncbi:MAG: EutN/CcmL family microcompartment protein [Pirellulales bacterium]